MCLPRKEYFFFRSFFENAPRSFSKNLQIHREYFTVALQKCPMNRFV
ncbi:hypothetical protein SXCC_02470 [Gluconacetobacter sp. SXCC-1]|nr:hypothetical protein SXCC_02470 [Gluconacetobacter sp. SXCC-1]